jgi:prephenate dehydrogenase
VGEIKLANRLQIHNAEVEKRLGTMVERYAETIGLDKELASRITDVLVDFSKKSQREQVYRSKITSFLRKNKIETVSVIGAGRMGGWFAKYFKQLGIEVTLIDTNTKLARKRAKELGCSFARDIAAAKSDLVLLAIPISQTFDEIESLQRTTDSKQCRAIIEISSVKGKGLDQISSRDSRIPVISIHPLFGSSAEPFGKNSLVVIQTTRNDGAMRNFVMNLFPQFEFAFLNAKAHDKQMALMLSLPHVLALAFADVISRDSKLIGAPLTTPSYAALQELAAKVFSENSRVYFEIETRNEFTTRVLRHLKQSIRLLSSYFEKGSEPEFTKFFETRKAKIKSVKTHLALD